jgi:hypothetical protein
MRPAIDQVPFNKLLDKLANVFGKRLTPDTRQAYWDVLQHHHLSAIEQRAKIHIANGKHFPRPVEIAPEDDTPVAASGPSNLERLDAYLSKHGPHGSREWIRRQFAARALDGKTYPNQGSEITGVRVTCPDGRVVIVMMADIDKPRAAPDAQDTPLSAYEELRGQAW